MCRSKCNSLISVDPNTANFMPPAVIWSAETLKDYPVTEVEGVYSNGYMNNMPFVDVSITDYTQVETMTIY